MYGKKKKSKNNMEGTLGFIPIQYVIYKIIYVENHGNGSLFLPGKTDNLKLRSETK